MTLAEILKMRKDIASVLSGLKDESSKSLMFGQSIMDRAKSAGVTIQNYLRLAIDLDASEEGKKYKAAGLDGYEATLAFLGLPIKNEVGKGVCLAQATETFATYPGTRILFQPVVDEILRFSSRQDSVERIDAIVGSSRTIHGNEMISIVADSDKDAEQNYSVAEEGRIPIRKIKTHETSVRMYKHGLGYEFTYEFDRRASIDIFVPYAARINREIELSKVRAATYVLINGDGVNPAAKVNYQEEFLKGGTNDENKLIYSAFLGWILSRAKANAPIDTILGNYDSYLMYLMLFTPTLSSISEAEAMAKVGGPSLSTAKIPGLFVPVNFALSSAMPEKQFLGYIKSETLQELIEEGSQIAEQDKAVRNQIITFVKTENTGYKLIFGDTRSIYTTIDKP